MAILVNRSIKGRDKKPDISDQLWLLTSLLYKILIILTNFIMKEWLINV